MDETIFPTDYKPHSIIPPRMQMQEEQTDAKLHKPAKCSISVSCYTVLVTNVHIRPTDNAPPYNKESSHSTGCHIPTRPPLHNAQWDCHHSATYFLLYFPSTNGYGYFCRFRFHLKKNRFPLINNTTAMQGNRIFPYRHQAIPHP